MIIQQLSTWIYVTKWARLWAVYNDGDFSLKELE